MNRNNVLEEYQMRRFQKIISLLIVFMLLIKTTSFANYKMTLFNEVTIDIKNITDEIKEIKLIQATLNHEINRETMSEVVIGTIGKVDKSDNVEWLSTEELMDPMIFPHEPRIVEVVEPYNENEYTYIAKDYDTSQYKIIFNERYSYDTENKNGIARVDAKFKNELELKEYLKKENEKSTLNRIDYDSINWDAITCRRIIDIETYKFDKVILYDSSSVKDGTLSISKRNIDKVVNPIPSYILSLETATGETKDFYLGYASFTPELETINSRKFIIDYSSGEIETATYSINTIMTYSNLIIFAIILTLAIEIFIAVLFKIKHYGIVLSVNLITQIFLHTATLNGIYNIFILTLIAEIAIVFMEFIIYAITIKDVRKLKLLGYSFIANLCTYLLSIILI